jgi:hypothetical protein
MVWDEGDFNYDGTVNSEDFTPLSHNLGQSDQIATTTLVQSGTIAAASTPPTASTITATDSNDPVSTVLGKHAAKVKPKKHRGKA